MVSIAFCRFPTPKAFTIRCLAKLWSPKVRENPFQAPRDSIKNLLPHAKINLRADRRSTVPFTSDPGEASPVFARSRPPASEVAGHRAPPGLRPPTARGVLERSNKVRRAWSVGSLRLARFGPSLCRQNADHDTRHDDRGLMGIALAVCLDLNTGAVGGT
jgi:hypothetical protein